MTIIQVVKKAPLLILACLNTILSAVLSDSGYENFIAGFAMFSPIMFLPGFFTHKARNVYIAMLVSVGGIYKAFEITWKLGGEIHYLMQIIPVFYLPAIVILWIITEIILFCISLYKFFLTL